uniref:Uncharacterized protein n=1 Tax=Oryza barthii TaxID=65489 RepID=A0A0D3GZ21_9ORYZ
MDKIPNGTTFLTDNATIAAQQREGTLMTTLDIGTLDRFGSPLCNLVAHIHMVLEELCFVIDVHLPGSHGILRLELGELT